MDGVHNYAEEKKEDGDSSSCVVKTDKVTTNGTDATDGTLKAATENNSASLPNGSTPGRSEKAPFVVRFFGVLLRTLVIDLPVTFLFAALVSALLLHKIHDAYFLRQLKLMEFQSESRDSFETTYYHRYCTGEDVSATSVSQLIIPDNFTAEDCAAHQMTHGVSVYRDLLTPETAHELREFIVEQNTKQVGFSVIQNAYRWSWGIDVNMHPAIKKYWKELASNKVLVDALQEIVGPDPAIIEFTAITSAYRAKDQHDHQDVVPGGSGAKFAHSFVPSYSLFIPLQDTSYDMGATHVCPGSHLCGGGCSSYCTRHNLAMSGENNNWPTGWGALVNQQTTHKGMGHTKEDGLDRVVIIATFAPRPQTFRGLETRMIGHGGSYSLAWHQWGHTFSDFANADERMWEPLRTMRSLGLVKGNGWTFPTQVSMRIANGDTGYTDDEDEDGIAESVETSGAFKFLPKAWQGFAEQTEQEEPADFFPNIWHEFLLGTLKKTEQGLLDWYKMALPIALVLLLVSDLIRGMWTRQWKRPSVFLRGAGRLLLLHAIIVGLAFHGERLINESNWAKDITAGKMFKLPPIEDDFAAGIPISRATLPNENDILRVSHYAADQLAAYGRVVDFAHPGNVKWNRMVQEHAQDYVSLTPDLQRDLCGSLLAYIRQDARFLKYGDVREWQPIEEKDELLDICHQDLVAASDKRVSALVKQLNSLKTNTKIGRFWNSAMHRRTIPAYLKQLEPLVVPQRPWSTERVSKAKASKSFFVTPNPTSRQIIKKRRNLKRRYSIPQSRAPHEPFPLAWLREFDIVESKYNCNSDFFYRGVVFGIASVDGVFNVEYDDGDVDEGLARHCLRPFLPYQVGETIQVRVNVDKWPYGTIMDLYEESVENDNDNDDAAVDEPVLLVDVLLDDEDETLLEGVPTASIRRFVNPVHKKGDRVLVHSHDSEGWNFGRVTNANADGTYFIKYSDGSGEPHVPLHRIKRHERQ